MVTNGNSTRIVVADDDEQVRKLFGKSLRSRGYNVIEAADGREAMRTLRQNVCDLLVLDLAMPDMDGFEVLRALHEEMPDLKVIATSGYMKGAFLEAAHFLGAMETLSKPLSPVQLIDSVGRLLAEPN